LLEPDEATHAERKRMGAQTRVGVVVGQLEAGNDEQPVVRHGTLAFGLELLE
jgi:hypothetical protein